MENGSSRSVMSGNDKSPGRGYRKKRLENIFVIAANRSRSSAGAVPAAS